MRRRNAATALTVAAVGMLAILAVPSVAGAKSKAFSSGPINRPIPNNDPVGVFAPVGVGKKGTVKDVNVAVRISHPNVSQLSLYLFKGEKYVRLASGVGGAGNDFGSGSPDCAGTFTIFDGAAPTFIQTGSPPFNGGFRPSESLAVFNGDKTKGTWRLLAFDDAGGTSGLVNCWVLDLKYKRQK